MGVKDLNEHLYTFVNVITSLSMLQQDHMALKNFLYSIVVEWARNSIANQYII